MTTDAERIEALKVPVERAAKSLRTLAKSLVEHRAADDETVPNMENLASWLEGAYAGDPSYCKPCTHRLLMKAVATLEAVIAVCVWPDATKPGFWSAFYGRKVHHFPCRKTAVESVILYGESILEADAEDAVERTKGTKGEGKG